MFQLKPTETHLKFLRQKFRHAKVAKWHSQVSWTKVAGASQNYYVMASKHNAKFA